MGGLGLIWDEGIDGKESGSGGGEAGLGRRLDTVASGLKHGS